LVKSRSRTSVKGNRDGVSSTKQGTRVVSVAREERQEGGDGSFNTEAFFPTHGVGVEEMFGYWTGPVGGELDEG